MKNFEDKCHSHTTLYLYDTHAAHTQSVSKVSVRVSSCQLSKSRGRFCPLFERFLNYFQNAFEKRSNAF